MTGANPQMKYPFIIKGKFMYLLISHNKHTKFTKVQLGKHFLTVKGKKINQDGVWPIALVCPDFLNLKIEVVYDKSANVFNVRVNGEPYLNLPYISPNQNYGVEEDEFISATVVINETEVLDQAIHWNFFTMSEEIEKALQEETLLKTLSISNLECSEGVANELLDLIASQNISEVEGLTEIVFSAFSKKCTYFDDSLLTRYVKFTTKLEKLEISRMEMVPVEAR